MQHAQNHIDRVVDTVIKGGRPDDTSVDPLIQRSWTRCINTFKLEPSPTRGARVLTQQELLDYRDRVEDFIHVAKIGIQDLYTKVSPLNYVVLLTDVNGITVDYIGNQRYDAELRDFGLYLGADWNERHVGTCGVGICATEMLPVTCHQGDHFDLKNTSLTCSAAPIFDPDGAPLGVLDVSALTSPTEKASQHLLLELVKSQAAHIESANFFKTYHQTYYVVRFGRLQDYVNINSQCMLAVDEVGTIRALNSAARRALTGARTHLCAEWNSAIGRHLFDYFEPTSIQKKQIPEMVGTTLQARFRTDDSCVYMSLTAPVRMPTRRSAEGAPELRNRPTRGQRDTSRASDPLAHLTAGDPSIERAVRVIRKVVDEKVSILLQGETGAGKEVFARAIHEASSRSDKPFVAVNCAAIPESLIESELFGYKAGTFTGARTKGMKGLIAQSSGGTLFLDEIGDMPAHLQTRLLRVLSEHEIMPLGGDQPIPVDLNVVAATHQDLDRKIQNGEFREDLYYRLAAVRVRIPALRERADFDFILDRMLRVEDPEATLKIAPEVKAKLAGHHWPGNLRELRNVLRVATALADNGVVTLADLPEEYQRRFQSSVAMAVPRLEAASPISFDPQPVEAFSSQTPGTLVEALRRNQWNVTETAQELGISRATIYRNMRKHKIVPPNKAGI